MKDLKARKYSPVYVLMGEEPFYIDKICDYISENVLQPEERDFNQTVVFGADVTGAQVADLCKGYPMMAEYRVVVVKEAQNLRNLEVLEKYLENPVKTTILVFCHKNGKLDSRKKFSALAAKAGVVFESKKLYDRNLPGFIETYLKTRRQPLNPRLPRWGRSCGSRFAPTHFRARQTAHFSSRERPACYSGDCGARNRGEQRLQCLRAEKCHHQPRCVQGKSDNKLF